ncbi:MAG TPA: C4-type zinc ribbon domain-containing protein [Acidimicrobiales bacterium]|nr:C4-type zinc ribbon domain-containing protein [Acidimicrobiales bacterium]
MSVLETLLVVQELDTARDQLEHRRATLPERAELAAAEARLAVVDARVAEAQGRRDEIGGRESRLEQEVSRTESRIVEIEKRLYSGTVSASRELTAMSEEVDALKARRSSLEDDVLLAMEEAEPVDAELATLAEERAGVVADIERLRSAVGAAEEVIDADLATRRSEREAAAAGVPGDLLATYERLRAKLGGVGAARLVGPSCTGCHLTLPATELDRIKREPPDTLVFCDQCGRILVR